MRFNHWIVAPHGALHYIPFAALLDTRKRRLIEDVAISYTPSASVWYHLRSQNTQPTTRVLGLANPKLNNPILPQLTHTQKSLMEVCKILSGMECKTFLGAEAHF